MKTLILFHNYLFSISKSIPASSFSMENKIEANKNHCKYCFDVLHAKINGKPLPQYPNQELDHQVPIFVTWKKRQELRGCIGTFAPGKLSKVLAEYAVTASMRDPRFPPVQIHEVKQLSVGVSLLVNFQQAEGLYKWQVGKHGIIIKASHQGRTYSGTFLPQVAKEQNWNQRQTLQYLAKKGGYYGKFQQIESKITVTTYESSKSRMDYEEYMKLMSENKQL